MQFPDGTGEVELLSVEVVPEEDIKWFSAVPVYALKSMAASTAKGDLGLGCDLGYAAMPTVRVFRPTSTSLSLSSHV